MAIFDQIFSSGRFGLAVKINLPKDAALNSKKKV
jgi:hypothetical protein